MNLKTNRNPEVCIYIITSLFIFLFIVLYAVQLHPLSFLLDDTYIVLHNTQVLITRYDINYPGVNALNGTTSLVHLALVRTFSYFLSPLWALYTVNSLAILVYALGLLRLAFIYASSRLQAVLFLSAGLLIGNTPFILLNGLETGLALATVTWTLIFITLEKRIAYNLLLGLLPFIRPELIPFTFIFWLSRTPVYWRQQKSYRSVSVNLLIDLFICSLSASPFILWHFIALGTPYLETLQAKKYFFAEQPMYFLKKTSIAIHKLFFFGVSLGIFNFISLLLLMLFTPLSRLFLLFFLAFFMLYLMILPVALGFNNYRYLYVWLPFMLYGLIACIRYQNDYISIFARFFLIILFVNTLFFGLARWPSYLSNYHSISQMHADLKRWCENNIPPDSTLLVQDAGYLAYATHFHLIDLVGLKTPTNIHYHQSITFPSAGQKRAVAIAAIIRATHPQYLIITQEWEDIFHFTEGLKTQGIPLQQKAIVKSYLIYHIG